jgi:tRNA (adenine37-N6)-methyltransferase
VETGRGLGPGDMQKRREPLGAEVGSGSDSPSLVLRPIGYVRSALATKAQAARQPRTAAGTPARIELLPGRNFEHALEDLARWELIWVIFWFHYNPGWRPKVLPPRSTTGRKGVFATRSPHRPNPLGISAVHLTHVEGLVLHIRDADMLDGTPVLDLKPYVAYTDAHPQAGAGWLKDAARADAHAQPPDPVDAYAVVLEERAAQQAAWIQSHTGLDIGERIRSTLRLGPAPHPYRRIRHVAAGLQLSVKEWRVRFGVIGRAVRVTGIESGFRTSQLGEGTDESLQPHREFLALWPRA